MLANLALLFLLIPFAIVGFWQTRPIIALIVAVLLAPLIMILPRLIQTFQAMMIYGTGDPQLMAGGIAHAITSAIMGMFIVFPALIIFQMFMRRRRRNKAQPEAVLKNFD